MTANAFVDTNILVYAVDPAVPRKQAIARQWLQRLWDEQRGRTSFQVLDEYYYVATRRLKPRLSGEKAWADVEACFEWEPLPTGRELLRAARHIEKRHRLSWWDSLIVAAARLQGCSLLLTEDLQHGLIIDGVTVHDPFAARVADGTAVYEAAHVAPRHRPRGRPRRAAA